MQNKEKGESWIAVLVVVALVAYGLWSLKNSSPVSDTSQNPTEDTSSGSVNVSVPAGSLSYAQALEKYKNARLQLDQNCQGSPDKMTFKNNSYLMVDNRSNLNRTIKVGSTFTVSAYGFKVVRLFSTTLPITWYVNCDQSKNVSTILIQK